MSKRQTRSTSSGKDLVYTEDPEAIARKRPGTEEIREIDTSTEEQEYMDASNVFPTVAQYDEELNPEDQYTSDGETSANEGDTRVNRNRTYNVSRGRLNRRLTSENNNGNNYYTTQVPLPNGEWYLPDLYNTPVSEVIMSGATFDKTGRYMYKFPKVHTYTGHDTYIVNPTTGEIHIYDTENDTCFPFVSASRYERDNSEVIQLIKTAVYEQKQKEMDEQNIPGEQLPLLKDVPYNAAELGDVLSIYEELCQRQGEIILEIHNLKLLNRRNKWTEIAMRETTSARITAKLDEIHLKLAEDNGLRKSSGIHTYPIPNINPTSNIIDDPITLGKFSLLVEKTIHEILAKAFRPPANYNNLQRDFRPNQDILDVTPTNTDTQRKAQPRKVGFTEDINHRLSQIAVETGPTSPSRRTSRTHNDSRRNWHTISDRERNRRDQATPSPNTISPVDPFNHTNRPFDNSRPEIECFKCGQLGHIAVRCPQSIWCDHCQKPTHPTKLCKSRSTRPTSTPRSSNFYPPTTPRTSRYRVKPHNQTTQNEIAELIASQLETQNADTILKNKKSRLRPIPEFDGKNKDECITWIDLSRAAARDINISLRDALMETAKGSVYQVISSCSPLVSDEDLTDHILEAFSDIPTKEDAQDKLRVMRRKEDPLISYNAYYSAIHRRAYGYEPNSQTRETVWREYANTLDRDFANKLNNFIGIQKGKKLHSLQDVMEKAKQMEQQERTNRIYKERKELEDNATHIKQVNEIEFDDAEEINFLQNRKPDPRFNSTMKPRYSGNYSQQSSGYQSSSPRNTTYQGNSTRDSNQTKSPGFNRQNQGHNTTSRLVRQDGPVGQQRFSQDSMFNHNGTDRTNYNNTQQNSFGNQGRRFVNKYQHPRGQPRNNIRFEYGHHDKLSIIKNLKNIIAYFENCPGSRDNVRQRGPMWTRHNGEVNESDIHEICINDICLILNQEVDTVYDALLAGDYIEETVNLA